MNRAANPHLELAPWFAGVPIADARAVGVLVHGRDQGPEVMLEVTERLRLDEVAYVLPAAAQRSWYPGRYYDPLAQNEPDLTWSLEACEAAIAVATDAGVAPRRIVLGGFSQGACLVAELDSSASLLPQPACGCSSPAANSISGSRSMTCTPRLERSSGRAP
jgi:phospholipase/carboxylesterase